MCGIVGFYNSQNKALGHFPSLKDQDLNTLAEGMLSEIRHRGPDEMGILTQGESFFANARLKIVDLIHGTQPMCSQSGRYWIVYNGEIYDHKELRGELEKDGIQFETKTDTEVIVNLFEKYGPSLTDHLNGEFSFAIYDSKAHETYLFRDGLGTKPLFYIKYADHSVLFASEIKPLLWATRSQDLQLSAAGVAHTLECWAPVPPETSFENIFQVKPGSYLHIHSNGFSEHRYKKFAASSLQKSPNRDELKRRIERAVSRRLVADVPVGLYLSGGLDSTIVGIIASKLVSQPLKTFSVEFEDPTFDESSTQSVVQKMIGSDHEKIRISEKDLLDHFMPSVLASESTLFRSATVPMFILSKLVQESGAKVVLTGEGSDELFGGYDIFKEFEILQRWSESRDANHFEDIKNLYKYLPQFAGDKAKLMIPFYSSLLTKINSSYFGHLSRWSQYTTHSALMRDPTSPSSMSDHLTHEYPELKNLTPEDQTRAVECLTLLHGYLLSSQGDRMVSSHSVEARLPFLDKEVVDFAFSYPVSAFMDGLKEKQILYDIFADELPQEVLEKRKQPFLSLDADVFFKNSWPWENYVNFEDLERAKIFNSASVLNLFRRLQKNHQEGRFISRRDNTAFFTVLTSMILFKELPIHLNSQQRMITVAKRVAL